MSTVPVPDFGALAGAQNTANDAATNKTNLANRPDQSSALGTSSWTQGPDGTWSQSTALNGAAQGLFDTTMSGQTGLAGQIGQGVDFSGLGTMPQVGGYNQQVIDSWNALAQPGLQRQSDAARQRAAAMGITMGSDASNDVEKTIGTNEATQRNQAILQGYTQGNTEYTQAMQARQEAEKEAMDKYSGAISGSGALTSARQSLDPNAWMAKTPASANYAPETIYGAAQDTFNANMQNQNSDIAQRNANIASGSSLLKTLGGSSGIFGSGGITGAAGDLWGGLKGLFGSSGDQGITDYYGGSTPTWGTDWSGGLTNGDTSYDYGDQGTSGFDSLLGSDYSAGSNPYGFTPTF